MNANSLRHICRIALTLLSVLLTAPAAFAQSGDSVQPESVAPIRFKPEQFEMTLLQNLRQQTLLQITTGPASVAHASTQTPNAENTATEIDQSPPGSSAPAAFMPERFGMLLLQNLRQETQLQITAGDPAQTGHTAARVQTADNAGAENTAAQGTPGTSAATALKPEQFGAMLLQTVMQQTLAQMTAGMSAPTGNSVALRQTAENSRVENTTAVTTHETPNVAAVTALKPEQFGAMLLQTVMQQTLLQMTAGGPAQPNNAATMAQTVGNNGSENMAAVPAQGTPAPAALKPEQFGAMLMQTLMQQTLLQMTAGGPAQMSNAATMAQTAGSENSAPAPIALKPEQLGVMLLQTVMQQTLAQMTAGGPVQMNNTAATAQTAGSENMATLAPSPVALKPEQFGAMLMQTLMQQTLAQMTAGGFAQAGNTTVSAPPMAYPVSAAYYPLPTAAAVPVSGAPSCEHDLHGQPAAPGSSGLSNAMKSVLNYSLNCAAGALATKLLLTK